MKWFEFGARTSIAYLLLLHEYDKKHERLVRLPRFTALRPCPGCDKWDENAILAIGFDTSRLLPMPQDILRPSDVNVHVVSDRFREVCASNDIRGVRFIPCGQSRVRGAMFILWPEHTTPCYAPIDQWPRGTQRIADFCHLCGRPEYVAGFPPLASLELPDERTISIPATPTYLRRGRDFRFFCSESVRQIFKDAGLKGCSFSDMEKSEKRFSRPLPGSL
jgi:hypothetical protein